MGKNWILPWKLCRFGGQSGDKMQMVPLNRFRGDWKGFHYQENSKVDSHSTEPGFWTFAQKF